jgi:hypothetical protein
MNADDRSRVVKIMGLQINLLKVVDGGGELRIMRLSFAGLNRPWQKGGESVF